MFSKKRLFVTIAISLVVVIFAYLNFGKSPNASESWNDGWEFCVCENIEEESSNWKSVDSSSLSKNDGATKTIWFRKKFLVPHMWFEKAFYINFDGVDGESSVYFNDFKFCFSQSNKSKIFLGNIIPYIDAKIKYGAENVVHLKVKTNFTSSPREILGGVNLLLKNPVHIYRDKISVSKISRTEKSEKIAVSAEIYNTLSTREKIDVYFEIKNLNGKSVAKKDITYAVASRGMSRCTVNFDVNVADLIPQDNGKLSYIVEVSIARGYQVLDEVKNTFNLE